MTGKHELFEPVIAPASEPADRQGTASSHSDLPGSKPVLPVTADGGFSDEPSRMAKRVLRPRTVLSFAIAMTILVIFFRRMDLDLSQVAQNIRQANPRILLAAVAVYLATIGVRAYRWRWMLCRAGAGRDSGTTLPSTRYVSALLIVSWFFNCVLPAKLGDAYRIYRVRADNGIRYSVGLGTVLTERFIDLIVLMAMLASSAALSFRGDLPSNASRALLFGAAMTIAGTLVLAGLWTFRIRVESILPLRFRSQFTSLLHSVYGNLKSPWVPAGLSVLVWILESTRVFLVARALNVDLSPDLAMFVGLMAALLTTLPITPAGLGVVEIAMVAVLKIADVPTDVAGSVALLDRLITFWGLIVIGAIVYLRIARHPRPRLAV